MSDQPDYPNGPAKAFYIDREVYRNSQTLVDLTRRVDSLESWRDAQRAESATAATEHNALATEVRTIRNAFKAVGYIILTLATTLAAFFIEQAFAAKNASGH